MRFLDIKTKKDFCDFFKISFYELEYLLNNVNRLYRSFPIKKRNGSIRFIDSPNSSLMILQKKINDELLTIYRPKKSVHAYCKSRGIKTNAFRHRKSKYVLNIDLENFFHTVTYNRVVGLFKSFPLNFNEEISIVLSKIACFKSRLPQGSPLSPVISNLVCRSLDSNITKLCEELKCQYTRYADDITISTKLKQFPKYFGEYKDDGIYHLSKEFLDIVSKQNFKINDSKTRFQNYDNRQVVTGITVNKKLNVNKYYIKKIRAILHSIEVHGPIPAMKEHFRINNISFDGGNYASSLDYFFKRIVGKISFVGFVKGKGDSTYIKLVKRIKEQYPEAKLSIVLEGIKSAENNIIITEGKTDWMHLKAAYKHFVANEAKFHNLKFIFHEYGNEIEMGSKTLLKFCEHQSKGIIKHKNKIICVFDRDERDVVPKVTSSSSSFKHWGNNIYSLVIPSTSFREFNEISIEHLYMDGDLFKMDAESRRLYLSTEFNSENGVHLKNPNITFQIKNANKSPLKSPYPKIIDSNVFDKDRSMALSKNNFAKNVLEGVYPFSNINFNSFEPLFVTIEKILSL